jgi:hypothetical protein
MTNSEVVTLSMSGLSLFVSIISVIRASKANAKANTLSQERNELTLRQARASEHAIFIQGLFTVNQRLQDVLPEFRREAEKAYNKIADMLDSYDAQRHRARPLRHIYGIFCDLIYAALSPQLVWSTNIHFRLPALWTDIEHDREDNKRLVQILNYIMYNNSFPTRRGIFKWLDRGPPVKAEMLAKGIHEIYERMDEKKEIFIKAYNYCQKYFELLENLTPVIGNSLKELKDLLEIDKRKEFKSSESYDLYQEYMHTITKLEFLSGCEMGYMKERYSWLSDNYHRDIRYKGDWIGDLLYMGVILSIITHYYTWGTDPVVTRNMFSDL